MKISKVALFSVVLALSTYQGTQALAQGDDCSSATAISGIGVHAFNNTANTTSMFVGAGGDCAEFLFGSTIGEDVFYQWTATSSGSYQIDLEGSDFTTLLRVHDGVGCAATCRISHDSWGSSLSSAMVRIYDVSAGDTFLIQTGSYGTGGGNGILNIRAHTDSCAGSVDDSYEPNDDCGSSTVLGPGVHANLLVHVGAPDFYSVLLPVDHFLEVRAVPTTGELGIYGYGSACGTVLGTGWGDQFRYPPGSATPQWIDFQVHADLYAGTGDCADYSLEIVIASDPCLNLTDDSYEPNNTCATASRLTDGTYPDLVVYLSQEDHYLMTVPAGSTLTMDASFSNLIGDIEMYLWDANNPSCSASFGGVRLGFSTTYTDAESIAWTNPSNVAVDVILDVNLHITTTNPCNVYDLVIGGATQGPSTPAGIPFCAPMNPNSSGSPTRLSGSQGSTVGGLVHLEVTDGPPGEFAYFLVGTASTTPGLVLSQGRLCLDLSGSNVVGRYNVAGGPWNSIGRFDSAGVLVNLAGTSTVGTGFDVPDSVPIAGAPTIVSGSTWHFQLWLRDNSGQSNFSNGLSVQF